MVDRIGNGGSDDLSPISANQKRKMYESEYKHAADLFERTLNAHAKSDNPYQKEAFRKVMDKSLEILKETASELRRQKLLEQNQQIEKDYAAYQQDESKSAKTKLEHDLERAKNSFS